MRKVKQFTAILMMMVAVVLGGCGGSNKSSEELTDIEQFKCQDSIQTVFDVLGETEIETDALEGELCKYEELNLWGYNGTAVFNLRDNNDTISGFYCVLKLNKKELEDVLSQLEEKHGEYEKHNYSNQVAYMWKIPENEAEELGYNNISFNDYGDKKIIISFWDEWSAKKDEAYYKHLEEQEKSNSKTLREKTYNIGEDEFHFSLQQDEDDEYRLMLLCIIEDKSDAFWTHILLNNEIMNNQDESIKMFTDTLNFSYCITVGDGTILFRMKERLLIQSKDGEMIDVNDYFSNDWILNAGSDDGDYGTQIANFLVDFVQNE